MRIDKIAPISLGIDWGTLALELQIVWQIFRLAISIVFDSKYCLLIGEKAQYISLLVILLIN